VLDHRFDQLIAAERRILETELFVLFLSLAHELARLHAEGRQGLVELFGRGRVLEILDDLGLGTVLTEQADRLPALASTRVVPDDDGHSHLLAAIIQGGGQRSGAEREREKEARRKGAAPLDNAL
jgi:hypothetical protein